MNNTLAVSQLIRFIELRDKNELSSISPNEPLFFIRYISKNKNYFNTLNDISNNHFDTVLSFVEYLGTHNWDLNIQEKYSNYNAHDLAYVAYLSNLISREFFYDFILLQSIIKSFTGQSVSFKDNNNEITHVPPLPKPEAIIKHVISAGKNQKDVMLDYVSKVKEVFINSGQFCFSETQFAKALNAAETSCVFEIKLNYESFQSMTSIWPHNVWFNLFFHSSKYALLQVKENIRTNEISIFIPGDSILNVFALAISAESHAVIRPVYAFGIVSNTEEARLHQLGYHLTSILDSRFRSLAHLHGRTGNSLECLVHDSIFHSIVASSHPEYIRRIFSKVYDQLNSIINPESLFTNNDSDLQLQTLVLDEFKSRCIGLGRLFDRTQADYHLHQYYCEETLKSVLIGTINQIFSDLSTYNLDISISEAENEIEHILRIYCAYVNKAHILGLPDISDELMNQVFLTATNERGYTMNEKVELEETIIDLENQLNEYRTRLAALRPSFFARVISCFDCCKRDERRAQFRFNCNDD